MTPLEVGHRVARAARAHAERLGLAGEHRPPPPNLGAAPRRWLNAWPELDSTPYVAAAERIAAGRFDILALAGVDLGSPPRWNRDPKTGVTAPLAFGKLLDYRDPTLVGDIRYLWELNRHQHLPTLAQAHALTGEARYFEVLRAHLDSWFAACPYRYGPNWASALEAALRLLSWSAAWQLLGGKDGVVFRDAAGAAFRRRWLDAIYQHAQFVSGWFSRHSSANNHLIGEAAGLFVAALTWPHWRAAPGWRAAAKAILERETLAQNAADGVNREQAIAYQQFELDLLLVCLLAGKANGEWFSAACESRIEAMLGFVAAAMDAGGNVAMFGDSDDALALRLSQEPGFCRFRSVLATGAVLFRRGDFKRKAMRLDDKTRWLLGPGADAVFDGLDAEEVEPPSRRAFPDGGYYVLGVDFEAAAEIRLVVDAGPLGYRSIAAHGHADALSFTLSVGGREFFVDPGTYAYHTAGPWRRYFRGTAAHNTVRVDGLDQSVPGGNFMWLDKARAGCSRWSCTPAMDRFEGWHDGYTRLADPVLHRRRIALDKAARRVTIEDQLEMAGEHDIELLFHCSERCRVERFDAGYSVAQESGTLFIRLPHAAGATARVYLGSTAPILGWRSRRFDDKQPAPTIAWRARLAGRQVLHTEILC